MKIKQYEPEQHPKKYRITESVLREFGPAFEVHEDDRGVVHVILLGEVLGYDEPPIYPEDAAPDQHRRVAVHHLRHHIMELLSAVLSGPSVVDIAGPCVSAHHLTIRLLMAAAQRLVEHGPDPETGVAPTTALLEIARQHLPEDRRRRCGKSRDALAHGYAKVGSALDDLVIVARERLAAKSELQACGFQWKMYDETKGQWAGFLIDPSREPGPEAVVYWLKSDGSVVEPESPGPPAGYPQRGFGNL